MDKQESKQLSSIQEELADDLKPQTSIKLDKDSVFVTGLADDSKNMGPALEAVGILEKCVSNIDN